MCQPCEEGEMCICITFGLNKRAEDDLFTEINRGHVLLSFFIQITPRSEHLTSLSPAGRVINVTGNVRHKLQSTNPSSHFLFSFLLAECK